jgi:hypothetical protein
MRLAAVQLCPWRVKRMEVMAPSTARSSGKSSNTIIGDLPPSSSVTGAYTCAAAACTWAPARAEPVNDR